MSYLLFMDESGHDHKNCPYEVRGGVAIHTSRLWYFVKRMAYWENFCFGTRLHFHGSEIKGAKLLQKRRLQQANKVNWLENQARRKLCRSLLINKGESQAAPSRLELTAYGQAGLLLVKGIFNNLKLVDAVLFASIIPRKPPHPKTTVQDYFLRKDQVFLFERFYHFLENAKEDGIIVMDEVEKENDRRFVQRMTSYFTKTENGKMRAKHIIPSPLFVSSDMAYPVQAADICIYCINWAYRLKNMNGIVRDELTEFNPRIRELEQTISRVDNPPLHSIVFVPDPYNAQG